MSEHRDGETDRTETLVERLNNYAFKATLLAEMTRDEAMRNAFRNFGQAFRDAASVLASRAAAPQEKEQDESSLGSTASGDSQRPPSTPSGCDYSKIGWHESMAYFRRLETAYEG